MTSRYKVSALTYGSRLQTTRVMCISNSIWVITSNQLLLILHPFNGLFSRTTWVSQYQKGKTSVDLNEARYDGVLGQQWHQLDHMQTICTSLQTDNHTNTSSLNIYRQDALPDDQKTVSKHWRHIAVPNERLNKLHNNWCNMLASANFIFLKNDMITEH